MNNLYFVLAQGGPGVAETTTPIQLIFQSNLFNFILVIVFLVWVARKTHVFSSIAERQNAIKQNIKNAEEEKVKSELELDATKKRVKRSDEEAQKITKEAEEIALSLSKRINKEADIEANEIDKNVDRTINAEKEIASGEITKDISNAAFIIAEEHIKQAIDERLHKKYINEFVDELDKIKI